MHIIVSGNAVEGLVFTGPFATSEAAVTYAESSFKPNAWHAADMSEPEGIEIDPDDDDLHLVVWGNAVDGLGFSGPFPCSEDAIEYAESSKSDWVTAYLNLPRVS